MRRMREVRMDGVCVKVSPLSWDEVAEYRAELQKLVESNATERDFQALQIKAVAQALTGAQSAAEDPWSPSEVREQFDAPFLAELQKVIFQMSGFQLEAA